MFEDESACLTGDHRVLTSTGWKYINRVRKDEQVLCFNTITCEQEWKKVTSAVSRELKADELYRMQSQRMDIIATRDHRMLILRPDVFLQHQTPHVTRRGAHPRSAKPLSYDSVDYLTTLLYKVNSTSTATKFSYNTRHSVIRAGINNSVPDLRFVIEGLEKVCDWWWEDRHMLGFLQFLGFWLGDGGLDVTYGRIVIKQKKQEGIDFIEEILNGTFPNWYNRTGPYDGFFRYYIRCPPLYEYLRKMCIGPLGYNPRDLVATRAYPHFDKDQQLATVEQLSDYYKQYNSTGRVRGTWDEDTMLRAMKGESSQSSSSEADEEEANDDAVPIVEAVQVDDDDDEKGTLQLEVPVIEAYTEEQSKVMKVAGLRYWNGGLFYVINGHWYYIKRWLGDEQQVAAVWSQLSAHQAFALLHGFGKADGLLDTIQMQPVKSAAAEQESGSLMEEEAAADEQAEVEEVAKDAAAVEMEGTEEEGQQESTGNWRLFNSSRPLLDHLSMIAHLAGAGTIMSRRKTAGTVNSPIHGKPIITTVDAWELTCDFNRNTRGGKELSMKYSNLAQPEQCDDVNKRGYYEPNNKLWDDSKVYCITVDSKNNNEGDGCTANFLTQRLCWQRNCRNTLSVRAQSLFVGNCVHNINGYEDTGVHHTSAKARTITDNQQRLHWSGASTLSSSSFSSSSPSSAPHLASSSIPFASKRRAIQFSNRNPDELEGDRIDPDHDTNSADDDIDFTQPDPAINHAEYHTYGRRSSLTNPPRGRASRRHPTVERSPHCQPLERNVNKPFLCIYPYTLNGRRVDISDDQQQQQQEEEGGVESGGGGSDRDRCGQEFSTRQACENHIRSRHTMEKLKCSFPNCGFSSTDVQNLNKHEKSHVAKPTTLTMQPRVAEAGLRMRSL